MPELIDPLVLDPVTESSSGRAAVLSEVEGSPPPAETSPDALDRIRDLVLRAYPDVVPELVTGDDLETLLASVEPATAAYAALATRFAPDPPTIPPPVPAGAADIPPIDPDTLPTSEKLRRGLTARSHSR